MGLFNYGCSIEDLTPGKHFTISCTDNSDCCSGIVARVVEGATSECSVGVIPALSILVVNKSTCIIVAEVAIGEHTVTTIINDTVIAILAVYICKVMIFGVSPNVDSCIAIPDITIRYHQMCSYIPTRFIALDSRTGEVADCAVENSCPVSAVSAS